ncbi:MAG: hypothetical protein QOJ03_1300 [Frankiaceae bacterium]|nr:hypothetical protein [Frankiaceae bacterium]
MPPVRHPRTANAVPRPRVELDQPIAALPPVELDETETLLTQRWAPRPRAARVVQVLVLALPVAAAVGTASAVSAALPRAGDLGTALGWWAIVVGSSTVALYAVDRVARRLLPLAWLLRLSLLFPDQAPKRYRIAADAWSSRRLRDKVEGARAAGDVTPPLEAATQVIGLLASLAAHDRRTRGHCERVRAYNDLLAEELGLSQYDRERLRWAALIHDIGKLKVSRRLLNKPGKPTAREWEVLRAHPQRGAEIAGPLAGWLGPWADTIAQHHERWDGGGYPHGLAGTDITLGARIVGVADAFEVMTSPRPYSRPVGPDAARAELATCAGTQFDPMVVRAFLNVSLGRLRKAMGPIAWFTQVPFLAGMPRLSAALLEGGRQAAVGAGGAAGVIAVTALPPSGGSAHHQLPPAAAIAPVASVTATAPSAGASTPALHVRGASHHRQPPGRDEPAARHHHRVNGALGPAAPPGRHHHSGDRAASADGGRASGSLAGEHGRCAGNLGSGLGNGGPRDPAMEKLRHNTSAYGRVRAPGLHACD